MTDAADRLGIDTEALWNERLSPFLEEREDQRKKAVQRVWIFAPLAVLCLVGMVVVADLARIEAPPPPLVL